MSLKNSLFHKAKDIIPHRLGKTTSISQLVELYGKTAFEARNVYRGAHLFKRMITEGDTIWLGIAGAGVAGGMGGMIISLIEAGFIDAICSTGAQVYHDLHFAFGLPVKAINPSMDDDLLRKHGDTRIYDIGIREVETLEAQDAIIREFVREEYANLSGRELSSWEFNYALGLWAEKKSKYPEHSFVVQAAKLGIPIFWDSLSNHSIAMNLARLDLDGYPVKISGQLDILHSAAIPYHCPKTGFVEIGGGGPKNFIQQTGPTISQILGVEFEGAERGLQITTAIEREGSLSSCTFSEAVTWGKYKSADDDKLVQIWGEYSIILPILAAFVLAECKTRKPGRLVQNICEYKPKLVEQYEP